MSKSVLVDTTLCTGCRACQVACKQWHDLPGRPSENTGSYENPPHLNAYNLTKVHYTELEDKGRLRWVFAKLQCMHCEHPGCVEACIVGALKKQADGPVTYDKAKCIGCRYCQVACPFGIPSFEWDKPVPWIQKCTLCADRQKAGLQPACVATCPNDALKAGEREALLAEARSRITRSPQKYFDHIYGEKEVGGTSVLYLSPVPFNDLGFADVGTEAVTVNAARAMRMVPPVLLGVALTVTGIYWLTRRKQKMKEIAEEKGRRRAGE